MGKHEEFTLYCITAISNMEHIRLDGLAGDDMLRMPMMITPILENPKRKLWSLAKDVDGWGRIHLVESLRSTEDPEIQEWILREGFRNNVLNSYLAYIAATTGKLHLAISEDCIDDELLISAGEIIEALVDYGPTLDIHNYEYGAEDILR